MTDVSAVSELSWLHEMAMPTDGSVVSELIDVRNDRGREAPEVGWYQSLLGRISFHEDDIDLKTIAAAWIKPA